MDELPGRIGPYDVRDRLGHGGMGVVYLAYDPMLDRPVAIKVLKVPDEETRRRFLREARLAARVHHPHIVSIYAVGEHEGNPYLAMEFIAGRTLAQIIRGSDQVPLARKVHWLSELCAGLGHAHKSGIVHRDVKPSNLLIAQSTGTLRLLDFGIAHGNETSAMTMAGMIVGTPQYMSPEQIQGHAVDARSDIFSVGAVAYELLTGLQAFGGDNLYHVSRRIVSEDPPPLESVVPDAPTTLIRTIAHCLQKAPASRPESAASLEREFLAIARRLDPDHTLVVRPAEPTMMATAKDATTSRRELLREAEAAIAQGELTTASGLLQKLESGQAGSEVWQLRHKLQSRRAELRLQDALAHAEEAVEGATLDEAESALSGLADLSPRHPELSRLRLALQARSDARQVATLTSRARQALQQDRLEEAEALLAEALALAPDAADAVAVQQKLLERTRAQRIARLVAQASRALDQDDAGAARRAIDALAKIDPAHRDVPRLQGRMQALTAELADAAAGPMTPARPTPAMPAPANPAMPTGGTANLVPATPVTPSDAAGLDRAAAAAAVGGVATTARDAGKVRPTAPRRVAAPVINPVAIAGATAAAALLRPAPGVPRLDDDMPLRHAAATRHPATDDARPAALLDATSDTPPSSTTRRSLTLLLLAVVVAVTLAGGGMYYALSGRRLYQVQAPLAGDPANPGFAAPPSAPAVSGPTVPAPVPVAVPDTTTTATAPQPTSGGPSDPIVSSPSPDERHPDTLAPSPTASDAPDAPPPSVDPWQAVRQFTVRGAFDRALAAIDRVERVPPAELQAERVRVVEHARRTTLAARRAAEDLRLTKSAQYVRGTQRQAQGDRQRAAGGLRSAVAAYMEARTHYLRAFADNGLAAAAAAVVAPPVSEPPRREEVDVPANAGATRGPDLSTWSNDEARAAIASFCGAYLARDMGGLTRLWPNLGPEWRAELREAFATSGELVCVFENVVIVRASDEFSATARLLTQLPGGEQRRRALVVSLVPAGDRLVIGNIRVR